MPLAIPASQIVSVNPGVVGVGGSALNFTGLFLTENTRVPIGQVYSFPNALAVSQFFGPVSDEYNFAAVYFTGFDNSAVKPGALLISQYVWAAPVPAYLRGGNISALTLAQLQAITPGTLTIVINGLSHTSSSINLSTATSFSSAAGIITTALASNDATLTGAIAATTANVTGSIAGTVLTVTAVSSGTLVNGGVLSGAGVTAATTILGQLSGTPGGIGTYTVSASQTVSSTAIAEAYGTLTVSAVSAGALALGQIVTGAGVTAATTITQLGTGTGGTGTYYVSIAQSVSSEAMTSGATLITYDSQSGAFILTGGTPGTISTIGFASGAIATSLLLTAATGAVTSQGAPLDGPTAYMNAIIAQTQNWVTFTTHFDPVQADKLTFALWTTGQNTEFAYVEWAKDVANTLPNPSTATAAIIAANDSGTLPIYGPLQTFLNAALAMGFQASIDFTQTNGRYTLAFRSQTGFAAEVTNGTVAAQLLANGLNFYGEYSTASANSNFLYNGSITGPFLWADSYFNAIWIKNNLQASLLSLLKTVGNIPYNIQGYNLIEAACADPINAALNFGAIRPGVVLSQLQIAEVNNAAGFNIATTLQNRGWYLLISPTAAATRVARGSPPITLFYIDGQSVQKLNVQSLEVQ